MELNYFEAVFWIGIGVALLARGGRSDERLRRLALIAAGVFALFGVSDFVEAQTGAWWRPWWLLLWKAGCIAAIARIWQQYRRIS